MTQNFSLLPSLPLNLGAKEIIGLKDPVEGDWARLRSLQYRDLHRHAMLRVAGHSMAAAIAVSLLHDDNPWWLLAAWLVLVALAVFNTVKIEHRLSNIDSRVMTRSEFTGHARAIAMMAALWSLPMLGLFTFGDEGDHHAMWTVLAMLAAGSAANMAQAPISSLVWASVCGLASAISFVISGEPLLAMSSLAFSAIIIVGSVSTARTFLIARIAEAGAAEKDEVVSLLLREFEENEADWLWQVDPQGRIRAASPRFAFALGLDPKQAEGQRLIELVAGERWQAGTLPPSLHELAERLKRRESFSNLTVQAEFASGRRWWELSGTPAFDDSGRFTGFRGVGSDVTEQRESSEKIAWLARYDTLTGLPNRLMLTESVNEALRYSAQWKARCAFLMIDLDRFKSVNDSLGHHIGDKLLAQVAQRLQQVIGPNEQVGRLGGDEFAVVVRDASRASYVADLAQAIIAAIAAPYSVDNHTLYIGASIGSALGPRDGSNVETLMRNADLALYRAKDEGGNAHARFEPTLHANAEERLKLEASLRHAIGKQELELAFQPVVNTRSEHVVSFEALLRWNSKDHGFVSPAKFIPLAEDTRLIVPIGEWVLREACREAMTWPNAIRVAVNVSGEQLLEPNFASTVVRALADTGLPSHRLEVEVTESVFLRDGRTARQTLEEILALGCSIALDDFGTGYSSLGYLRTLRFSTIKVDRSFVQGAAQNNAESLAIINAVVAMANSLEMSTTAEGVEDAAQAAMIRDLGCTKIQGYYFGRPMPALEARSLVVKRRNIAAA
ncbi:putative bifunctional diguanylate cyclase/phosphodiesterase [Alteraurantiacibacter buctensis]